jgi:hypothetical protein
MTSRSTLASSAPAVKTAARLNSFRVGERKYWPGRNGKPTTLDLVERASRAAGLNCVDLNYPDHVETYDERELVARMGELGVALMATQCATTATTRFGSAPSPTRMQRSAARRSI